MSTKNILFVLILLVCNSASAELYGEMRDKWFVAYPPVCYKHQRELPVNSSISNEDLSRYCTCLTQLSSKLPEFTNELARRIDNFEVPFPATIMPQVDKTCQQNYSKYPVNGLNNIVQSPDGNGLLNGQPQRFTAFSKSVFLNSEGKRLESKELKNGEYILDLNVALDRIDNNAIDIISGKSYNLIRVNQIPITNRAMGIDFMFTVPELLDGYVFVKSTSNALMLRQTNPENGQITQIEYINSVALLCKALSTTKSNVQKSMIGSIFKEAILIAIRSYGGASYSGGTFSGTTTMGQSVSGTYTQYNNSWLGEHYSNGLNAVFNDTASYSQIDEEMSRLKCREP